MDKYQLLPGTNDDAIWERIKRTIGGVGLYADRKPNPNPFNQPQTSQIMAELLEFFKYEKETKESKYGYPSAPFIIPIQQTYLDADGNIKDLGYNKLQYSPFAKFESIIALLKIKSFETDAAEIEELMMELQKVFSLRKVTIHGKDLQLKHVPSTALPKNDRLDVPTVIKKIYKLGQKSIEIHWDALERKSFFVRVERVAEPPNNTKIIEIETPNHFQTVPISDAINEVRVKVMVKKTPTAMPDFGNAEGTVVSIPNENLQIQKYRMNPSNSLYPIDRFRLEICDKYKTIYDLFRLVPKVNNAMSFVEAYRNIVINYNEIFLDNNGDAIPLVKWEYLRIPNTWKSLSYWEKVLVIVFKGKPMEVSVDAIRNRIATLYDADIINKPYATDPAKGGSQRVTGAKRPHYALATAPTQMEYAFANRGNQYKAVQIQTVINDAPWKKSQKYFKKNSVVYGREYHEFIYLDTRLEREACDTLRRVDRLLRLSNERGYPVLDKNVAAPYNYANNTSFARDTMFGVNNYDRTQSYPPLQAAPLIMATAADAYEDIVMVEDPQKTFDRRGMTKKSKMIPIMKVNTGNDDIYYNHPIYRSKQKRQSWETIING
tara:strand:+ start:2874 stop:4682 length:1809 start_codon:yes stop_codon:yes gene_type:complete